MGYVADAFAKLKSNLEITQTEQNQASSRRQAIYDLITDHWDVKSVFLTGSYHRHTKTKKLKDVDIFVVIDKDGEQGSYRSRHPSTILQSLKEVLETKYDNVTIDGVACVISFGADEEIMSFEVVPAFERSGGGYEIPDPSTGGWLSTDPTKHAEATTAKNGDCDQKWVPFVKMIKGMNREADSPIEPSFLIEVMALDLVRPPFGRYQDEIAYFCASAADQVANDWPDPADIGPIVNRDMSAFDRELAARQFRAWQKVAEDAIDLEDEGRERAAVDKWRELFGYRMPKAS